MAATKGICIQILPNVLLFRENKQKITSYQHKKLTKFFETNSFPDDDQIEIIGKSVAMTNIAVDCWFSISRTLGPEKLWQEAGEVDLEEWKKKKEEEETEL